MKLCLLILICIFVRNGDGTSPWEEEQEEEAWPMDDPWANQMMMMPPEVLIVKEKSGMKASNNMGAKDLATIMCLLAPLIMALVMAKMSMASMMDNMMGNGNGMGGMGNMLGMMGGGNGMRPVGNMGMGMNPLFAAMMKNDPSMPLPMTTMLAALMKNDFSMPLPITYKNFASKDRIDSFRNKNASSITVEKMNLPCKVNNCSKETGFGFYKVKSKIKNKISSRSTGSSSSLADEIIKLLDVIEMETSKMHS